VRRGSVCAARLASVRRGSVCAARLADVIKKAPRTVKAAGPFSLGAP
jgi:hypothetical protein